MKESKCPDFMSSLEYPERIELPSHSTLSTHSHIQTVESVITWRCAATEINDSNISFLNTTSNSSS